MERYGKTRQKNRTRKATAEAVVKHETGRTHVPDSLSKHLIQFHIREEILHKKIGAKASKTRL